MNASRHPWGGANNANQASSAALLQKLSERRSSLDTEREQQKTLVSQQQAQIVQRIESAVAELIQLNRELTTQRQRVASVQTQLDKFTSLAEQKFLSEIALAQKRDEWLDQQSRLQTIERAITERQRDKNAMQNELSQIRTRSDREREQLGRAVSELEGASISTEAQRLFVVTAPQAGTVTAIVAELGQLATGSPLLTILSADATLVAQLFAPSNGVGFIEPNQSVNLRFAAFPYQKFGQYQGTVTSVSKVAL